MRTIPAIAILVALAFAPGAAQGACTWEWLCDAQGQCTQAPVCDSSIDLPPVRPPEVKPIVPPTVRPIQPPTVPPVGTSNCEQVRRCDRTGSCVWDTVCR